MTLPFRPVAIALGKTVNNGWGGYECCWARTLLACLVGALEVPGGTLGTTVRLNRPADNRWSSVKPGPGRLHGLSDEPDQQGRAGCRSPSVRSAHRTLVPLVANSPWSQALGPTHLAWMMQNEDFDKLPHATPPDVWLVYRTNPAISFWDTKARRRDRWRSFPSPCASPSPATKPTMSPTCCCPTAPISKGCSSCASAAPNMSSSSGTIQGFALRDPAVPPQGEAKDFTWIATELARRTGLLAEYNGAINRGAPACRLSGANYDFSLDSVRAARRRGHLGRDLPGRERRTDRRRRIAGARLVPRTRLPGEAVLAPAMVSLSEAGRARAALRAALSGAAVPHRQGAGAPPARARHPLVGPADRGIRAAAALARPRPRCGRTRSPSTSRCASRTIRSGSSPRAACNIPGATMSASSSSTKLAGNVIGHGSVVMNETRRGKARHRRRRPRRGALAAQRDQGPRHAVRGHPPRHAPDDRPVRAMGDALRQGLQCAEHECADADAARPDRRDRIERRPRQGHDQRGSEERAHDPLGDARRSRALRRLPDLHRRLPARQRDLAGGAMAQGARRRGRHRFRM